MRKKALKRQNPNRHKGIKSYRKFASEHSPYFEFTNVNGTKTRLNFHKKVLKGEFLFGSVYKNDSYQKDFNRYMNNLISKNTKTEEAKEEVVEEAAK